MPFNFDELPARQDTDSFKWRTYPPDVLPMWVADMDFVSPPPVVDALRKYVERGVFGYPRAIHHEPGEGREAAELIAARLAERYHWQVSSEEIVFFPGVVTGFTLACHAAAAPQGGVLVQTPLYPPILQAPLNAGVERHEMQLTCGEGGAYEVDVGQFREAFAENTRLFILCNPHNPVGRVFRKDELERMAEICLQRGVVICSDEVHCDLLYRGQTHIPIASLSPEIARRTITLMAPSKTFNLAGLQFSFAIIQDEGLRNRFRQATGGLVPWINAAGWVAAEAAYRFGQPWLDELLVYLEGNRDLLVDFVARKLPGISLASPQGTYLAWLDCRGAGLGDKPAQFFLEKARVAFNEGATFGRGGEGFVRLNFGCPRAMLVESLHRMRAALASR
ncbi:MAG: PatB family C-S lyase [Anaerolineales bacterium]|nr:PatB family C-S lyase [Anaerolineales bacterium]